MITHEVPRRPSRSWRRWRVVVIVGFVVAMNTTLAAPSSWGSTTGNVGPYRFSTGTTTGGSGMCRYGDGTLSIAVTPPLVKMRAYWTRPHNGQIAAGQWMRFTARLIGMRGGTWSTLASEDQPRYQATKDAGRWMRMPTLAAFTQSSGVASGYSAYRVVEKVEWLRPLKPHQNQPEGSASITLTDYNDGAHWFRACSTPPAPVTNLRSTATSAWSLALSWTNPSAGAFKAITVRYAEGADAPTTRTSGIPITLPNPTAGSATITGLKAATRYAVSTWVMDAAGHYSIRKTTAATTTVAPVYDASVQRVAYHDNITAPWEEAETSNHGNVAEQIGVQGQITAGIGQLSQVTYAGNPCSSDATTFHCSPVTIAPNGTEPLEVHVSRTDPSAAISAVLQVTPADGGLPDSYTAAIPGDPKSTITYRTNADSESGNIFGSSGDNTLGQGHTVTGYQCSISDQFVELLNSSYSVVATAEGLAQATTGSFGAQINQNKVGSTDTSVSVHWWYNIGVAARYQVRYTISGWNCAVQ